MIESERKYLDACRPCARRRLGELGAISEGLHFESNAIFDMPDSRLRSACKLLRVRLQEWPGKKLCVLTYKQPAPEAGSSADVKLREELEVKIDDSSIMRRILSGCGFVEVARYEKAREQWHFEDGSAWAGLKVDLDLMPFGFVVEIEGEASRIDSLAQALLLDKFKISLKTYHELNQEWREATGRPASMDLTFEAEERVALRRMLGLN